jgi:hypothetical protein
MSEMVTARNAVEIFPRLVKIEMPTNSIHISLDVHRVFTPVVAPVFLRPVIGRLRR